MFTTEPFKSDYDKFRQFYWSRTQSQLRRFGEGPDTNHVKIDWIRPRARFLDMKGDELKCFVDSSLPLTIKTIDYFPDMRYWWGNDIRKI